MSKHRALINWLIIKIKNAISKMGTYNPYLISALNRKSKPQDSGVGT